MRRRPGEDRAAVKRVHSTIACEDVQSNGRICKVCQDDQGASVPKSLGIAPHCVCNSCAFPLGVARPMGTDGREKSSPWESGSKLPALAGMHRETVFLVNYAKMVRGRVCQKDEELHRTMRVTLVPSLSA